MPPDDPRVLRANTGIRLLATHSLDYSANLNQNQSNYLLTFNTQLITALNLPISVQFGKVREGSVPYQQLHSLQMPGCTAPVQRGDTVLVLLIHLRAMFNQHRHELDKPTMSSALQWRTATNEQRKKNKQYIKRYLRHAMVS